jgi:hypothetical protein
MKLDLGVPVRRGTLDITLRERLRHSTVRVEACSYDTGTRPRALYWLLFEQVYARLRRVGLP